MRTDRYYEHSVECEALCLPMSQRWTTQTTRSWSTHPKSSPMLPSHQRYRPHESALRLLQPLAQDAVLSTCRDSPNTWRRDNQGNRNSTGSTEVLDLEPLFKSWREVWSIIPSHGGQTYVFDLSLTESNDNDGEFYWSHTVPKEGGMAVMVGKVHNLIVLLATVMNVRSKRMVHFELAGTGLLRAVMEGRSSRGSKVVSGLEDVLEKLSSGRGT